MNEFLSKKKNQIAVVIAGIVALFGGLTVGGINGGISTPSYWNAINGILSPKSGYTLQSSVSPVSIASLATATAIPEGSNLLTNGSFDGTPFDLGWTTSTPDTDATLTATTTASSTMAAICTMTGDDATGCYVIQSITSTADLEVNFKIDLRATEISSASSSFTFFFVDATTTENGSDLEGFTQCMNKTSMDWQTSTTTADNGTGDCEFDLNVTDNPTFFNTSTFLTLDTEALVEALVLPKNITVPATGRITLVMMLYGNTGDEVIIDNVELYDLAYSYITPVSPNLFSYGASSSTLDDTSEFCIVDATDGCQGAFYFESAEVDKGSKTGITNFGVQSDGGAVAVSTTPTVEEIELIFGKSITEVSDGFVGILGNDSDENAFLIGTRDGEWFYVEMTKALAL